MDVVHSPSGYHKHGPVQSDEGALAGFPSTKPEAQLRQSVGPSAPLLHSRQFHDGSHLLLFAAEVHRGAGGKGEGGRLTGAPLCS